MNRKGTFLLARLIQTLWRIVNELFWLWWFVVMIAVLILVFREKRRPDPVGYTVGPRGKPKEWRYWSEEEGLPGNVVSNFAYDSSKDDFYLVLNKGWCRFNENEITVLKPLGHFLPAGVAVDTRGTFWGVSINTQAYGVFGLNNDIPTGIGKEFWRGIVARQNGEVWVSSAFGDLIRRVDVSGLKESVKTGIEREPEAMVEDSSGNLWILGKSRFARIDGEGLNLFPKQSEYQDISIRIAAGGGDGTIWCGLKNGDTMVLSSEIWKRFSNLTVAIDEFFNPASEAQGRVNCKLWTSPKPGIVVAENRVRTSAAGWTVIPALHHLKARSLFAVYSTGPDKVYFFTRFGIYQWKIPANLTEERTQKRF